MELIPSGYDEKHYFVYGQCSEICITIKGAPVSKLGIFLSNMCVKPLALAMGI